MRPEQSIFRAVSLNVEIPDGIGSIPSSTETLVSLLAHWCVKTGKPTDRSRRIAGPRSLIRIFQNEANSS